MQTRSKLLDDLAFVDALLNMAGAYHPLWKELLIEARENIQRELLRVSYRATCVVKSWTNLPERKSLAGATKGCSDPKQFTLRHFWIYQLQKTCLPEENS